MRWTSLQYLARVNAAAEPVVATTRLATAATSVTARRRWEADIERRLDAVTSSLRIMSISRLDVRHLCPFRNSEMGRSISGYAIRYLSRDQEIVSTTVYRKLFTNK